MKISRSTRQNIIKLAFFCYIYTKEDETADKIYLSSGLPKL